MRRVGKDREKGLKGLRQAGVEKDRKGIQPIKTLIAFELDKRHMKEDLVRIYAMNWLWAQGWRVVNGPDPPDFVAFDGRSVIGIEVVACRFRGKTRQWFSPVHISKTALAAREGSIFFLVVLEEERGKFKPFILTRNEMAAKCKGKSELHTQYQLYMPKNLKGWEEHRGRWDKLRGDEDA